MTCCTGALPPGGETQVQVTLLKRSNRDKNNMYLKDISSPHGGSNFEGVICVPHTLELVKEGCPALESTIHSNKL